MEARDAHRLTSILVHKCIANRPFKVLFEFWVFHVDREGLPEGPVH